MVSDPIGSELFSVLISGYENIKEEENKSKRLILNYTVCPKSLDPF